MVELPAIRVESRIATDEVRTAAAAIGDYDLVCLTSPNGVKLLFEAIAAAGLDARALAGATVAAIGPGTARALAAHGIAADVIPERFVAEALVEALAGVEVEGKRVLVARAAEARDVLPDALSERGADVDVVALYETVREAPDAAAIEAAQAADYVTFTSSSTVTNLTEALGDRFPAAARIVSIGPVTSGSVREAGLEVAVEADRHDVDGLLAALLADAATHSSFGTPHRHFRRVGSTNTVRAVSSPRPERRTGPWSPPPSRPPGEGGRAGPGRRLPDSALLYSAVVRPLEERHGLLPLAVGVAVCEVAEQLRPGVECKVKWPNDIHLDGRKLAGILIEARPRTAGRCSCGLNLPSVTSDSRPRHLPLRLSAVPYGPRGPIRNGWASDARPRSARGSGGSMPNRCSPVAGRDALRDARWSWGRRGIDERGFLLVRLADGDRVPSVPGMFI